MPKSSPSASLGDLTLTGSPVVGGPRLLPLYLRDKLFLQ